MAFSLLNLSTWSLTAQQTAMDVTANNLTNATTSGYQVETADLAEVPPIGMDDGDMTASAGELGEGVTVSHISRAGNALLTQSIWQHNSQVGQYQQQSLALNQVQNLFQEPSPSGLEEVLSQFFSSIDTLGQNPQSAAAQNGVIAAGQDVAQTFNQMAGQLMNIQNQMNQAVSSDVQQVNQLAQQVAGLNRQIAVVQGSGQAANALLDERGQALDSLSKLVNITVASSEKTGMVNVFVGTHAMVSGTNTSLMTTTSTPPPGDAVQNGALIWPAWADNSANPLPNIGNAGVQSEQIAGTVGNQGVQSASAGSMAGGDVRSGSLFGAVYTRDVTLQGYSNELNNLATSLASAVNGSVLSSDTSSSAQSQPALPGYFRFTAAKSSVQVSSSTTSETVFDATAAGIKFVALPAGSYNPSAQNLQTYSQNAQNLYQTLTNNTVYSLSAGLDASQALSASSNQPSQT
ncbi:MAG: flagellar hook-associated protein FlgK, partial [Firmicutes bacterium]|nr:flagellar hook-associated protein FlgK [Bacillota bacterium]